MYTEIKFLKKINISKITQGESIFFSGNYLVGFILFVYSLYLKRNVLEVLNFFSHNSSTPIQQCLCNFEEHQL